MLPKEATVIILALTLASSGEFILEPTLADSGGVRVTVTVDILKTIVSPIIDGVGEAASIVSGEAEPHSFTLTPSIIKDAANSDLIVVTGHMEWERELIRKVAEERGVDSEAISLNLLEVSGVRILEIEGERNLHGFWLLPENALAIAGALTDKLRALRPEYSQRILENYESFKGEVNGLKGFLESLKEKHGLRGGKAALTFYAEQYIAEAVGLEADAALIGEEGMVKPNAIVRIREGAKSGEYACIIVSEVALLMGDVKEKIEEISRETGCPAAYVLTVSASGLRRYEDVIYYNAGQIYNAILSRSGGSSNGADIYYLSVIAILLTAVFFETLLLIKVGVKR
jgi:ABC-type Zn uptake system ZnuABC Zn-binding protein ZnuA